MKFPDILWRCLQISQAENKIYEGQRWILSNLWCIIHTGIKLLDPYFLEKVNDSFLLLPFYFTVIYKD
jgi:hypothetical protein